MEATQDTEIRQCFFEINEITLADILSGRLKVVLKPDSARIIRIQEVPIDGCWKPIARLLGDKHFCVVIEHELCLEKEFPDATPT
jgi:hypothetical protein